LPLATFDWTAAWICAGSYALIVLIAFAIRPRDVQGRRRAWGCIIGLLIFFGLFVLALGGWLFGDVL
jgi:hypothetical protein